MSELYDTLSLRDVNEAITTIMKTGQSYRIGSRQLTRADLSELISLRTRLMQEEAVSEGGGSLMAGFKAAEFDGR